MLSWIASGTSRIRVASRVLGVPYRNPAELEPKPDRPIPIWLGTYGERALRLTGRLADGWIPSLGYAPAERLPIMRESVLAAARGAGREPEAITCVLNVDVRLAERADAEVPLSGPAGAVAERLLGFVKVGFTAVNFIPAGPDKDEQVERLAREVIPEVRAGAR